ncbi:hypothetical protein COT94_00350 [Candidatus Falkowbacteria bacterium CG10_big_fil_rev_8_21_14_0_10_37_14]|uniref:LamG-like jellyroll fold domain-containing protein n=1 Tax=Candidatus Falkowbacteria bacterium CG10_big_fil_rev_8_21_14_0_10_37_14 TaxID=1974561 RepID=A0A2M6WUC5_9BACT|nr:MAG: hypothetical protein COT94_00350 [Candidatus Falkowbacteria bacterium CG10_big_fil_rev_8_21_14_0_10_37_14]
MATLATVAVNGARTRARDAKRISDMKQISTALEMYYADYTAYPNIITPGQPLVSADGSKTYMAKVPNNPTPRAEGACADLEYQYSAGNDNYSLIGCLSKAVGDVPAGSRKMEKGGQARDLGPTNGLVGWWMLDGVTGTKDLSGGGNNGALTMGTSTIVTSTGRFGEASGAYEFNGVNNYIDLFINSTGNFNNYITVSFWVKPGPYLSHYTGWLTYGTIASKQLAIWRQDATHLYHAIDLAGTGGQINFITLQNVLENNWHHYVMVVTGSKAESYLDESYKSSLNFSGTIPTFNSLRLGAWGAAAFDNSVFSDLRIYNRALSSTEVSALYNATKP